MSRGKKIGVLIICLCLFSGLYAELNWWASKAVPVLSGYIDSHSVAINRHGKAIAMVDDRIFASYDVNTDKWEFYELDFGSNEIQLRLFQKLVNEDCSFGNNSSKSRKIALNDDNTGVAIFRVMKGVHKGKIGCLSYSEQGWSSPTLLSDREGVMPSIAQSSNGCVIAVWINKEETDQNNCLMGAYYDGIAWTKQGIISSYKSINIDHTKDELQLGMDEFGDAVVVWKAQNKDSAKKNGLILANYFDAFEEEWSQEEIISEQPLGERMLDSSINKKGDMIIVWDNGEGIVETGYCNLITRILNLKNGAHESNKKKDEQRNFSEYPWIKASIAQGEGLRMLRICMNNQGDGLVAWLDICSGINSMYFNHESRSWSKIAQPLLFKGACDVSMQMGAKEKGYIVWVNENDQLSEEIYSSCFDFSTKHWENYQVISREANSLISHLNALSISMEDHGILIWYDFFKEQLFFTCLKEGEDPTLKRMIGSSKVEIGRKQGKLYEKKKMMAKRRAEGKNR